MQDQEYSAVAKWSMVVLFAGILLLTTVWGFTAIQTILSAVFQNTPVMTFDKSGFYMPGFAISSIGFLVALLYQPITKSQPSKRANNVIGTLLIAGIAIAFVLPYIVHSQVAQYAANNRYIECKAASHQWVFYHRIVYTIDGIACSSELKNTSN
ncbi:hypothetical protein [Aurantivibrio plasticivorans]